MEFNLHNPKTLKGQYKIIDRRELWRALVREWPAAFTYPRPLKIGIYTNIKHEVAWPAKWDEGHAHLHDFNNALCSLLDWWVHQPAYLAVCTEGAIRVDLTGQPAGFVSAAEAEYARGELMFQQWRHMA
jgi:sRNA-binding protein